LIQRNIKRRLNFRCRTMRIGQKSREVAVSSAGITFGYVQHDRYCRSPNLIAKREILRKRTIPRNLISLLSQYSSFLPGNDVLKSLYLRHCLTPRLPDSET